MTGASRGIGRAIARRLSSCGAAVVLLARESGELEESQRECAASGSIALPTDLRRPEQIRDAFANVTAEFGRLDALVNNAAIAIPNRIEDVTDDEVHQQFDLNVAAPILCTRSALPLLRASQRGAIINISSDSARDPFPYQLVYGVTKAALDVFTRSLYQELREDSVTVTLLVAGRTNTGGFSRNWPADLRERAHRAWEVGGYLTRIAGKAPQEPSEVADAVEYVLTRSGAGMIDEIHCRPQ